MNNHAGVEGLPDYDEGVDRTRPENEGATVRFYPFQGIPRETVPNLASLVGGSAFTAVLDSRFSEDNSAFAQPMIAWVMTDKVGISSYDYEELKATDEKPTRQKFEASYRAAALIASWLDATGAMNEMLAKMAANWPNIPVLSGPAIAKTVLPLVDQVNQFVAVPGLFSADDGVETMITALLQIQDRVDVEAVFSPTMELDSKIPHMPTHPTAATRAVGLIDGMSPDERRRVMVRRAI